VVGRAGKRRTASPVVDVALLGCGRIAQHFHLEILSRLPHVRLVAVAEPDPERRKAAGVRVPGVRLFADYDDLLASTEAAAVVICLPSSLHAKAASAALGAGRHVYLEKPLVTRLEDARAVLRAWEEAGTVGMIGFNFRFNPLYIRARSILSDGALGPLIGVRTVFSSATRQMPEWKRARESGGGALLDLGSHHFDLVPYLLGRDIAVVAADITSVRTEGDTAVVQFALADGLPGQSLFSICAATDDRIEVYGQEGRLSVDRFRARLRKVGPHVEYRRRRRFFGDLRELARRMGSLLRRPGEPSFGLALQTFVEAVRDGNRPHPDLGDGYRSLLVLDAAERSAREGRAVEVQRR